MSRAVKIALLTLTTVVFVLAVTLNYMSTLALEFGQNIGLFYKYNSSEIWSNRNSFKNYTFAPLGWAFSIWGVIYFYQFLILGFCWTLIFRRAYTYGTFLCVDPDLLPSGFMLGYIMSTLCNGAWVLVSDRVDLDAFIQVPMAILLFGITIGLYIALFFSYWKLWCEKAKIVSNGKRLDYWLVVGIVQNGLSMYATWVTIASFINLDSALFYYGEVNEKASSIGCLAGVMTVVVIYAIADLTVLDQATRFVFTPHLVVIWASCGSLARNLSQWSELTYMVIVLLPVVVIALILKFVLIFVRLRSKPILANSGEYPMMKYSN